MNLEQILKLGNPLLYEKSLPVEENDMAELIQHECDHLDGILATQRAVDSKSFKLN